MQEAHLREAGLGDKEIGQINALGGYRQAARDLHFMATIQDILDAYLSERHISVRNALREMGWDGPAYKPLLLRDEHADMRLSISCISPSRAANVVAMSYVVAPVRGSRTAGVGIFDDLSRSAQTLADKVHMLAHDYLTFDKHQVSILDQYGSLLRSGGPRSISGADFEKSILAAGSDENLARRRVLGTLGTIPLRFTVGDDGSITARFDADSDAIFAVRSDGVVIEKEPLPPPQLNFGVPDEGGAPQML
jgi:hypothetical protein